MDGQGTIIENSTRMYGMGKKFPKGMRSLNQKEARKRSRAEKNNNYMRFYTSFTLPVVKECIVPEKKPHSTLISNGVQAG
jgi:hypothetical protein